MKPSKTFFWLFWVFLILVAAITLVANIFSGNVWNIAIIIAIAAFLTALSIWLYRRYF